MLRSAASASVVALALVAASGASAETVAPGVPDGLLALDRKGAPSVAFVRGTSFVVATRRSAGRWAAAKAAGVTAGSNVMAFTIGASGPVALVQAADDRTLLLVRRRSVGWQTIRVNGALPPQVRLGWPGLALSRGGTIWIGYTRWNSSTLNSRLLLARVGVKGRVQTTRITFEGFPQSFVPPPAVPVIFGGRVHVIESYGYRGVLGTFEWFPRKKTWIGLGLDAGVGAFPIGPLLAGLSRGGVLHAAWTQSLGFTGDAPVTLVERRRVASSELLLDRALTTALALPGSGPEVAANQWVSADDLGLVNNALLWSGTIVRGRSHVGVDGWLAGLAVAPRGGRDLLLGGPAGLRWFRSPRPPATQVSLHAAEDAGSVALTGGVSGVAAGRVTLYRERPGETRRPLGRVSLSAGSFAFTDRSGASDAAYRAVYVDPATGIPYAALTRP